MSKRYVPPLPPPSQQSSPLFKQRSWSPDAERDEAWLRRKEVYGSGIRRSQSFTEDDLDELKGCLDLGFGFEPDSPEISRSSSASSMDSFSDAGSANSIIDQGDDPETVNIKLRQWAQVVACSVRQFPRGPK
ncbi:hypothetical protein ES332_A13G045800v1 [Gossypium tomentosum]|uniref:Uncharacterized protein n=1 Tax=Gossypium tomentosum TaxID=34277 RepID=A0A5D2MGA2_GOSTO|nr:hypothetical protein ES332_A13G045800v1 [Gossypium tomentosum]